MEPVVVYPLVVELIRIIILLEPLTIIIVITKGIERVQNYNLPNFVEVCKVLYRNLLDRSN